LSLTQEIFNKEVIDLFKHFSKLPLIFIIVVSLVFIAPVVTVFADDDQNIQNMNQIRQDVLKYALQFEIRTPKRSGRDSVGYFSGVAIFEYVSKLENSNEKIVNYISYFILSLPHGISDEEWDLQEYQKHNVRIYLLGKNDKKILAQVIAWEWDTPALLLQVDLPENELENFQIRVAKIASQLPVSTYESRYSDKAFDNVVFTGYPVGARKGELITNLGYFFDYYCNYHPRYYIFISKVATANIFGYSGGGQSGGPIFNLDKELVGLHWGGPQYSGSNFSIVVTVDVMVERFLKRLLELKGLNLPSFDLEEMVKDVPVNIIRPVNVHEGKKQNKK